MLSVIQKDLLYLETQAILDKDDIACYWAIQDHVHGSTNTDIRKARQILGGLKKL
jgi:hypothetical protein